VATLRPPIWNLHAVLHLVATWIPVDSRLRPSVIGDINGDIYWECNGDTTNNGDIDGNLSPREYVNFIFILMKMSWEYVANNA